MRSVNEKQSTWSSTTWCICAVVKYEDNNLQNSYWEGFTQAREVTNIFVFAFGGTLSCWC